MTGARAFARDMADIGLAIETPWDLVNSRRSYRAAIPLLLGWLERAERDIPPEERERFREGLVRSLAVKEARRLAAPALLREFRRPDASPSYRWAVGNSLEVVADDTVFDEVAELAHDRTFGTARQMVVLALGRMKDPRVLDVLEGLLEDEQVGGHAVSALARLKSPRARPALERSLQHPQPWVRKEASKGLRRLG